MNPDRTGQREAREFDKYRNFIEPHLPENLDCMTKEFDNGNVNKRIENRNKQTVGIVITDTVTGLFVAGAGEPQSLISDLQMKMRVIASS